MKQSDLSESNSKSRGHRKVLSDLGSNLSVTRSIRNQKLFQKNSRRQNTEYFDSSNPQFQTMHPSRNGAKESGIAVDDVQPTAQTPLSSHERKSSLLPPQSKKQVSPDLIAIKKARAANESPSGVNIKGAAKGRLINLVETPKGTLFKEAKLGGLQN